MKQTYISPLRKARQDRGWSLDTAANQAGVSKATISRIEQGTQQPRPELLATLVELYGLDPLHILLPSRYAIAVTPEA